MSINNGGLFVADDNNLVNVFDGKKLILLFYLPLR